jgi:hypothetical protein
MCRSTVAQRLIHLVRQRARSLRVLSRFRQKTTAANGEWKGRRLGEVLGEELPVQRPRVDSDYAHRWCGAAHPKGAVSERDRTDGTGKLIGQTLVAEAERRGYEIHPIEKSYNHRAGIALVVRGHACAFEIVEMTDRLSMTEAELKRWRRDNRYRLSYRPELEPSQKQVPNARLKLPKQRSASLAEGVFVADIAAMERCPLVRTCDQRGRASAGPGRDCLRPCSSRLGRPGIALGVPVLSSCRTAWQSQFGGKATGSPSSRSLAGARLSLGRASLRETRRRDPRARG